MANSVLNQIPDHLAEQNRVAPDQCGFDLHIQANAGPGRFGRTFAGCIAGDRGEIDGFGRDYRILAAGQGQETVDQVLAAQRRGQNRVGALAGFGIGSRIGRCQFRLGANDRKRRAQLM